MSPLFDEKTASARSVSLAVWLTFLVLLACFNTIYQPFFPLSNARMGHDYAFMLPAWLDGLIWFRKNGLDVPWFSPSFCAGQPFFPDPQSTFYSLPQLINIVASPLNTAFLTLLLSASLMFWGGYLLMRKVFATGAVVAVLVGGMLMFNGFLPHRILVGHVTFHGFSLVPWIALLLLMPVRARYNHFMAAVAAGLMMAYWVHAGFGTLILAGGLSIVLIALVHALNGGAIAGFLWRGMFAGVLAMGVAIAKLWATFSFLSNFPRTSYLLPGAASVSDAVIMIAGGLFLPSEWAFTLGNPLLKNVQWGLGPHEWAYNFGIAAALLTFALIAHYVVDRIRSKQWRFSVSRRQLIICMILLPCLAWPLAFNIWDPTWTAFLKTVPVINSASVPLRWVIVYIPILAVVIGLFLWRARWGQVGNIIALVCLTGTVAQVAFEPRKFYLMQEYDARPISIADSHLRSQDFIPAIDALGTSAQVRVGNHTMQLGVNDTFIAGVSQIFCYNPVFGYRLEKFSAANLEKTSVLRERDGFLNLKNPACYVYPKENNCSPGDRFRSDQLEQAKAFIDYRPFSFNVSKGQKIANLITQFSLIFIGFGSLAWFGLIFITFYKRDKKI